MIVSIIQPAYLPWLGYFDRLQQSDLHVVLDHVHLDANSKTKFANRNRVRTRDSWTWLTVPLRSKGKHGQLLLNQVEISEETAWRRKHWQTLKTCYSRTPHFLEHEWFFEDIYSREWIKLNEPIELINDYLRKTLGIACRILKSSEMQVSGEKSELILNICRSVGAKRYISGPFGRDYLNCSEFEAHGITLDFHDYEHPTYKQAFSGFQPCMSVVDLLFNHGPKSLGILSAKESRP